MSLKIISGFKKLAYILREIGYVLFLFSIVVLSFDAGEHYTIYNDGKTVLEFFTSPHEFEYSPLSGMDKYQEMRIEGYRNLMTEVYIALAMVGLIYTMDIFIEGKEHKVVRGLLWMRDKMLNLTEESQ
jgi:hypothetical protein